MMALMSPAEALAEAVLQCTTQGTDWVVLSPYKEPLWSVEADTKVDEDDLTYPAIVHMRPGVGDFDIVILAEARHDDV